ncbi:hypothetical protein GH714_026642 [Hevea brasiliensis]|uniref:Uncharacterized protein n=1 Tax=Hevea brasiliensis TaxID=3981 RepID=A0A6A6LFH8_HEVBR|nr:hypothetical protein GH714_026642 [Hevea brasiliensis]
MDSRGKDKRRRIEKDSDASRNKKMKQVDPEEATEEEVEEFFAILRRMQVAVKYFEKGNGEGWRAAVEAEMVAVVGGGEDQKDEIEKKKKKKKEEKEPPEKKPIVEEATGVLDLNVMPEI